MKYICKYSGLHLEAEGFSSESKSASYYHPIFTIHQAKLLGHTSLFFSGNMNERDSYLLFLALLKSTEQFEFTCPAIFTPSTPSLIAQNMEHLLRVISATNLITHPSFVLPKISISKDTRELTSMSTWLDLFGQALKDFQDGYRSLSLDLEISRKEKSLEKLIKNPSKGRENFAASLASWASLAGSFPKFPVSTLFGKMTCAEYWQLILRKCVSQESLFAIPEKDIQELTEHCLENIPVGSIFSHELFSLLKQGEDSQDIFSFKILSPDTTSEDLELANYETMAASAPSKEPFAHEFSSKIEYLRAKARWDIAVQLAKKAPLKESEN